MDCIFCKIANGEIPSNTIFEDKDFKVILDISPANKGHCLIIPKNHFENLFDIDDVILEKTHLLSKKIANIIRKNLKCEDINILQNNGKIAGQTVFHYHLHIIPRNSNDKVNIHWDNLTLSDNDFKSIISKLS